MTGEREGVLFSRGTLVPLTNACCFSYRVFPHVDSIPVQISLRKRPTFYDATLVSRWSEVWETTAEISYWWRMNTQIWVVLSISWSKFTGGDSSNKGCFGRKTNLFPKSGDFAGNRETGEIFREIWDIFGTLNKDLILHVIKQYVYSDMHPVPIRCILCILTLESTRAICHYYLFPNTFYSHVIC